MLSAPKTVGRDIPADEVESALARLDAELGNRDRYIEAKVKAIDSIRATVDSSVSDSKLLDKYIALGDLFRGLDNDSALHYFALGRENARLLSDSTAFKVLTIKRSTLLPLAGFVDDALSDFGSISPSSVPDSLKSFYYDSGRQLYSYMASLVSTYPELGDRWQGLSNEYRDHFLDSADPESTGYRLFKAEALFDEGKYTQAKSMLMDLISELPDDSNYYARACHILASIARIKGDENEAIYYLALSSVADTRGAVLEVMSLQELGVMMSQRDEIDRAYNYLSAALNNAVDCHASMRIIQTSSALPFIQKAHADQIDNWRHRVYLFFILLGVILLGLIGVLIYLHRQMKLMTDLQNHLRSANQIKEVYISQFFRLCSVYIDKLNQFCKTASRKISAGQIDDLYKITKSGKLVDEQSDEFYQLFDDAFLHIYPTFVENVNQLLREKIVLKEGEKLNNDLRILAFLRLGLDDTNQVAQILNYSVNTIYAYRNKLRNRAFNRDTFEDDVMKISSI